MPGNREIRRGIYMMWLYYDIGCEKVDEFCIENEGLDMELELLCDEVLGYINNVEAASYTSVA